MSKRVTVLVMDLCDHFKGPRGADTVGMAAVAVMAMEGGAEWICPERDCAYVCRVIELDLGPDPAALFETFANEVYADTDALLAGTILLQDAANALKEALPDE